MLHDGDVQLMNQQKETNEKNENQIRIEPKSNVVTVQTERINLPLEEGLLQSGGNGRLPGRRQTLEKNKTLINLKRQAKRKEGHLLMAHGDARSSPITYQ